ncbi:unnamed protein product [Rotaria sp. Silwood2]|nr:unnamed protein product [Rotaria sp. Silwood2]CAF3063236.1 unnamed protein product [Rotaria sp. Silwood2]CAF3312168.1 unnamed protein product [Rotaria sp. Silwood2]
MGGGARQEDPGSHRMILLHQDLEWVLGSSWENELPKILGSTLYENLNKPRNARYESKCGTEQIGIGQRKKEHETSKDFMIGLSTGDMEAVEKFLLEQN